MSAGKISMGIVDMVTNVTLDMKNWFAVTTIVVFLVVKKGILEIAAGTKNMDNVTLHRFASLSIVNRKLQII